MTRLLILCSRPFHLSSGEAERWLREQAQELVVDEAIDALDLTAVSGTSRVSGRQWNYLIQIQLAPGHDPDEVVAGADCAGLLSDLRELGTRPCVVVVDDARTVTLATAPQ